MIMTAKYTLPAFLVPIAIVLTPHGEGLIGQGPLGLVLLVSAVSALAVAALAVATGAWLFGPAAAPERILAGLAALLLLYLEPTTVLIGLGALALAVAVHVLGRHRRPDQPPSHQSSPDTHTTEVTS